MFATFFFICLAAAIVYGIYYVNHRPAEGSVPAMACQAPSDSEEALGGSFAGRPSDFGEGHARTSEDSPLSAEELMAVTRRHMYDTLVALRCQPELDGEDGLTVEYQGETFNMRFWGRFVSIWDLGWLYVREDEPDLPLLRQAMNVTNFRQGLPSVMLYDPNEEGQVCFCSRRDILLPADYPDSEEYVRSMLLSFFRAKEYFKDEIRSLKNNSNPVPDAFKPSEN